MPDDPDNNDADRHEKQERLIGRFIYEPEFRIDFWKDPEAVLRAELGDLNDFEQCWVKGLVFGRTQQDELIKELLKGGDYHTEAW